ncbi:iripin-2-like [Amblyomma americanum]
MGRAKFKGLWVTKFNRNYTKSERFFNFGTSEVARAAMHVRSQFRYFRLDNQGASALEVPYQGEELFMAIVLPDDRAGVPRLRNQLSLELLRNVSEHASFTDINLRLPKFYLQARYNLVPAVRTLGLSDVFGESAN